MLPCPMRWPFARGSKSRITTALTISCEIPVKDKKAIIAAAAVFFPTPELRGASERPQAYSVSVHSCPSFSVAKGSEDGEK